MMTFREETIGGITVRHDEQGRLDEIFAGEVRNFHLEVMDDHQMWLGFETPDGKLHHVWFTAKSRKFLETVLLEGI